jgi:hypothetical protein
MQANFEVLTKKTDVENIFATREIFLMKDDFSWGDFWSMIFIGVFMVVPGRD